MHKTTPDETFCEIVQVETLFEALAKKGATSSAELEGLSSSSSSGLVLFLLFDSSALLSINIIEAFSSVHTPIVTGNNHKP